MLADVDANVTSWCGLRPLSGHPKTHLVHTDVLDTHVTMLLVSAHTSR